MEPTSARESLRKKGYIICNAISLIAFTAVPIFTFTPAHSAKNAGSIASRLDAPIAVPMNAPTAVEDSLARDGAKP
jgi:hypothetical protein